MLAGMNIGEVMTKDELISKQQIEIENLKTALSAGKIAVKDRATAKVVCSGCNHYHGAGSGLPDVCNPRHLQEIEAAVIYTKKWRWWGFEYDHYRDGVLIPKIPVF